jgi:ubiquinone/menaquinone biosynthesis C-methylase UbiE
MDVWSDWLLHRRHGDDPEYGRVVQTAVRRYADRVLDNVPLAGATTLVDVGSGEGLVAFRAIERADSALQVTLTDISAAMLHHAESVARERNVHDRCTFVECPADRLQGIPDSSADIVTTRASLAYVSDKQAAFREIHRVLKPGGHFSIAEPILQDDAFYTRALRNRVTAGAHGSDRFLPLLHRWKAAQFPDTEEKCASSAIANFSERDLFNLARHAGFAEVHLQLHIDEIPSLTASWEVFLDTSPHPWAPSLRRILAEQFTPEEYAYFEKILRPTVESGKTISTERVAYMQAAKPL